MIMKEVKARKRSIAVAWIDYRKVYNMVPNSWIVECLKSIGVNEEIIVFMKECMKSWRVELTSGNDVLGEVQINRGILFIIALLPLTSILRKSKPGYKFTSGEKINHLLFMDDLKLYGENEKALDSLVQTVRIFTSDIRMEFGIEKCATMIQKRGKVVRSEGIKLPDEKVIKSLQDNKGYKYLGILQVDRVRGQEMIDNITKEYKRRVRKVLETKLNGENVIKRILIWAVSLIRYSAAFLDWTKEEKQGIDRKTRKLITMHKGLHPKSNTNRLYIPRKEGGRGLLSTEDTVDLAKLGLKSYVRNSCERLLVVARQIEDCQGEGVVDFKNRKKIERQQEWKDKTLHGQFLRQTDDEAGKERWMWLKGTGIKRETDSLILAAQEQAIRTNAIKAKIDNTQEESKCRMCGKVDETVNHIVSECNMLAQREYKRRHDCVGRKIHWELCRKYRLAASERWYEHQPETFTENDSCKLLWDFSIQTDHVIQARRPDVILIDKGKKECKIIDIAIPYDSRANATEMEKIEKYQDLAREVQRLWKHANESHSYYNRCTWDDPEETFQKIR